MTNAETNNLSARPDSLSAKIEVHPLNPSSRSPGYIDDGSWPSTVVFSDWDGTITTRDSNDYLTDNLGYGADKRRAGNLEILSGRTSFRCAASSPAAADTAQYAAQPDAIIHRLVPRDEFRRMLDSVADNGHTLEDCHRFLTRSDSAVQLDPGFTRFRAWCDSRAIPFVVLSSGMAPTIRAVLSHLAGQDAVRNTEIVANDVEVRPDGRWRIRYRHPESPYGHDKSLAILPWRRREKPPLLVFFGDGVSDMSAARHADLLFVKRLVGGNPSDLSAYCTREGIPHLLFDDFGDAVGVLEAILSGERAVADVVGV